MTRGQRAALGLLYLMAMMSVAYGAWLMWPPAGFMVAGIQLWGLVWGIVRAREGRR